MPTISVYHIDGDSTPRLGFLDRALAMRCFDITLEPNIPVWLQGTCGRATALEPRSGILEFSGALLPRSVC